MNILRIFELRLPVGHAPDALLTASARALKIPAAAIEHCTIRRRAIDARKKNEILLVYTVDVCVKENSPQPLPAGTYKVKPAPDERYVAAVPGREKLNIPPVIAGSGPAGLFAGLLLAQSGYRPVVIERGKPVERRCADVERFWKEGVLDPESNAQFGEGGAGTFSDGKLNTTIHDLRIRKVLEEFVSAGADKEILSAAKPHIGTDRLRTIVRSMRKTIIELGGEVRFECKMSGLLIRNGKLAGIEINGHDPLECTALVLAIGHSAHDTFSMLRECGVPMQQKPFAIGVRIEHTRNSIDMAQYGKWAGHPQLGAADYKMAWHGPKGRSAFTFCMCPGGKVIAASSEPGTIVTNGMSYFARNEKNANSALLVTVTPADYPNDSPLAGFTFQKIFETKAFEAGGGDFYAPVQLLNDFRANRSSTAPGNIEPTYKPGVSFTNLNTCLPGFVTDTIRLAIPHFAHQLHGFDHDHAVLTGVETRSSCPVRITRNDNFQSTIGGIYPAGEGAGYAGGIMSAAVDGIRTAEAIISRFCPLL